MPPGRPAEGSPGDLVAVFIDLEEHRSHSPRGKGQHRSHGPRSIGPCRSGRHSQGHGGGATRRRKGAAKQTAIP